MMIILQIKQDSYAAEKYLEPDEEFAPFIGRIDLPFIGLLTAKGSSEQEVRERLMKKLEEHMKSCGIESLRVDPYVTGQGHFEIYRDKLNVMRSSTHGA